MIDGVDDGDVFATGITITAKPDVVLPAKILDVCDYIQEQFKGKEFSIVCRGEWRDAGFIVSEEYQIPKQEVDGSSVYYDQAALSDLKQAGYNVVIHSHPFKSTDFSHTDKTTINAHFPVSVLYSEGDFVTADVQFDITVGLKLQVKGDVHVTRADLADVSEEALKNITIHAPVAKVWVRDDWYGAEKPGEKNAVPAGSDSGVRCNPVDVMDWRDSWGRYL